MKWVFRGVCVVRGRRGRAVRGRTEQGLSRRISLCHDVITSVTRRVKRGRVFPNAERARIMMAARHTGRSRCSYVVKGVSIVSILPPFTHTLLLRFIQHSILPMTKKPPSPLNFPFEMSLTPAALAQRGSRTHPHWNKKGKGKKKTICLPSVLQRN